MVQVTLVAPAVSVQTLGAGGQQAQNATQSGVPAAQPLSPGALLSGIITGKDTTGSYLLKTDQGTFTLQSNTPLTYNSDVLIRVDTSHENTSGARIVSVNGEAFADFSAPIAEETDSVSPSLLAKAGVQTQAAADVPEAQTQPLKPLSIPAITVPTPATPGQPQPQVQLPAGTPVTLVTSPPVAPEAPAPQPAIGAQASVTATPGPAPQTANTAALTPQQIVTTTVAAPQSSATTQTAAATPQAAAPQTAGAQQAVVTPQTPTTQQTIPQPQADEVPSNVAKLLVAQPAALADASAPSSFFTPAPAPQPQAPVVQSTLYAAYTKSAAPAQQSPAALTTLPAQLTANVVESHPDGTITLQTPQGALTVQPESLTTEAHAQLTPGAPLTVNLPAVFSYITSETADPASDTLTNTLKQVFGALQAKSPTAANDLLARLPAMGSDFLSSSINFMSALLQGNGRKILGENATAALQDSGTDALADKFDAHAAGAAQQFQQSSEPGHAPSWQSVNLPFVYQGAVQEARIYVKREAPRKTADAKKTTKDTRFIVEISFDDLGELQLDGIVLPKEKSTTFDLIVRSQVPFLPEERQEIAKIYAGAAELTGFQGSINFSVSKDFPVRPLAEMLAARPRDIIA